MVKTLDLEVLNSLIDDLFKNSIHIIKGQHNEQECEHCVTREGLLSSDMENKVEISTMFLIDPLTNFIRPSVEVFTTLFILGQKYQDEMAKKEILEALQEVVKGVDEHLVRDLSGLN